MLKTEIFVANTHIQLRDQINRFFARRKCANVRFLQLAADGGEYAYAVLAAWDEES